MAAKALAALKAGADPCCDAGVRLRPAPQRSVAAARTRLAGSDARLRMRRARTAAVEAGASLRLAPRSAHPAPGVDSSACRRRRAGWLAAAARRRAVQPRERGGAAAAARGQRERENQRASPACRFRRRAQLRQRTAAAPRTAPWSPADPPFALIERRHAASLSCRAVPRRHRDDAARARRRRERERRDGASHGASKRNSRPPYAAEAPCCCCAQYGIAALAYSTQNAAVMKELLDKGAEIDAQQKVRASPTQRNGALLPCKRDDA